MLGRRCSRRQGERLQGRGAGEARRDRRVQLVRISRQGDARRRERKDDERSPDAEHGRSDAVRRETHDHRRFRFDRRRRRGRQDGLCRRLYRSRPRRQQGRLSHDGTKGVRSVPRLWRDARRRGVERRRSRRQGHRLCPRRAQEGWRERRLQLGGMARQGNAGRRLGKDDDRRADEE